jgi:hypothetical protein
MPLQRLRFQQIPVDPTLFEGIQTHYDAGQLQALKEEK